MTYGTEKNNYDLILRPDGCGSVEARGTNRVDEVRVCARSSQSGILVDVQWKLSAGTVSYATNWQTTLVRGGYVDGGATDDVRFTLAMK